MSRCYTIAEAGVNHNGSLPRAIDMVRAAAAAGCSAFKVQAFTASEFVGPAETYTYMERDGKGGFRRVTERQRDMFDRCALSPDAVVAVYAECRRLEMTFVATATDAAWIERVKALGPGVMLKVGSDDIIHAPLLRAVAASKLPAVLSTGMASEDEISAAVAIVRPIALLHCVSLYPTPVAKANLRRMLSLHKFGHQIGYSDHTEGTMVPMMAAAMGATMIEKHFTLDKGLPGPDHWFSADPAEMRQLVSQVGVATSVRGTGYIEPEADELAMRTIARRSVVAAQPIPAGVVLQPAMVAYRRPGTGMKPGTEGPLLGQVATRAFAEGEPLEPGGFLAFGETVH